MDKFDAQSPSEVWLYCPINTFFFPNISEQAFNYLYLEDETDLVDASKIESGANEWLESMKSVLPHVERLLPDIEVGGSQYDEIRERIVSYGVDVEVHGDKAWFAIKLKYDGETAPDITRLKEYAAEQLLVLSFEISDCTTIAINNGIFLMELFPADYYSGPNQYNIEGNYLLLRQELPGQKDHAIDAEKPSVLARLKEAAQAQKEGSAAQKEKSGRIKSGPEL